MEDEDLFRAVGNLERGQALVTTVHAVIKKFGGQLVAVRVGCGEPVVYELRSSWHAVEWMNRWDMRLWPTVAAITKQLPNDMDEVDYVIRLLLGQPALG